MAHSKLKRSLFAHRGEDKSTYKPLGLRFLSIIVLDTPLSLSRKSRAVTICFENSIQAMVVAEELNYVSTLRIVVSLVLIRFAIALDLVSLHGVLIFSRRLAIVIFTVVLCRHAIALFVHQRKMQKLPGLSLRNPWRMIYKLIFTDALRGFPLAVIGNEVLKAWRMFRFQGDDAHMYAIYSWTQSFVIITSADAIKEVVNHPQAKNKSSLYSVVARVIGDGLLTSNGDKWKSHRKLLTPAFHLEMLETLMLIAVPRAELLIRQLEEEVSKKIDRSVDNIIPYIFDNNADVICQSSMGLESADESIMATIKYSFSSTVDTIMDCIFNPLLVFDCFLGLSCRGKRFKETKEALNRLVEGVISDRMALLEGNIHVNEGASEGRSSPARRVKEPFIDSLIREHWRNPDTFSYDHIREETTTFAGTAGDTTLWATTYTLLLLGHHPEVQETLYQELQDFFADSDLSKLTCEQINRFTYLNAVFNESLRLFPPVPVVARKADQDITIKGQVIPKETNIVLSILDVHMNEKYWPDAHRFKPERFLSRPPEPYTFIPFSAGARSCIGQKYANIQAKITIMTVIRKYRIQSITQLDEVITFIAPVAHTETPIKLRLDPRVTVDHNIESSSRGARRSSGNK